jgi:hypothetical protein
MLFAALSIWMASQFETYRIPNDRMPVVVIHRVHCGPLKVCAVLIGKKPDSLQVFWLNERVDE